MARKSPYLKAFGDPECEELHSKRPVPILLLAYLTHEGGEHERSTLAKLFWPGRHIQNEFSCEAFCLREILENSEIKNKIISVTLPNIRAALSLELFEGFTLDFLNAVHRELIEKKVIKRCIIEGIGDHVVLHYSPGQTLLYGETPLTNSARLNLRGVIHKIEHASPGRILQINRASLRSLVASDLSVFNDYASKRQFSEAIALYSGPFLSNIESRLSASGFEIGADLAEWLNDSRKRLTKQVQMCAFGEALKAFANSSAIRPTEYVRKIFLNGEDFCLDDQCAQLLLDVVKLIDPASYCALFTHLSSQAYQVDPNPRDAKATITKVRQFLP